MILKPGLLLPFAFGGLAVALPGPPERVGPECAVLCIDGINDCGQGWGGCYNVCEPEKRPKEPPCTITVTPPPPPPKTTSPPPSPSNCSTISVCADYINECGQMYGGCFADCKPWPTFSPPPCTKTKSTLATVKTTKTTKKPQPTKTPNPCAGGKEVRLCIDKVNECGMKYGGCYDTCATPTPSFVKPPCPPTAKPPRPTRPTRPPTYEPRAEPAPSIGLLGLCTEKGPHSICVDAVNDCGQGYGGCYDFCKTTTFPFKPPPCTSAPPKPTKTSKSTKTTPKPTKSTKTSQRPCETQTICIDYINECGMGYGGCHSICSPTPTYTPPPCPKTTRNPRPTYA